MEAFKDNPMLAATDLKNMVKKQHNYNATLSTSIRARAMALSLVIGDYKELRTA